MPVSLLPNHLNSLGGFLFFKQTSLFRLATLSYLNLMNTFASFSLLLLLQQVWWRRIVIIKTIMILLFFYFYFLVYRRILSCRVVSSLIVFYLIHFGTTACHYSCELCGLFVTSTWNAHLSICLHLCGLSMRSVLARLYLFFFAWLPSSPSALIFLLLFRNFLHATSLLWLRSFSSSHLILCCSSTSFLVYPFVRSCFLCHCPCPFFVFTLPLYVWVYKCLITLFTCLQVHLLSILSSFFASLASFACVSSSSYLSIEGTMLPSLSSIS